jgi:hypothetical protein
MVLQHAKRIVAAGPGDAIEGPALGEKCWKRGITIAGGMRTTRKLSSQCGAPVRRRPEVGIGEIRLGPRQPHRMLANFRECPSTTMGSASRLNRKHNGVAPWRSSAPTHLGLGPQNTLELCEQS